MTNINSEDKLNKEESAEFPDEISDLDSITLTEEDLGTEKSIRKKRRKWPIVLSIVVGVLIVVLLAAFLYIRHIVGGMKIVKVSDEDFGITTETVQPEGSDDASVVSSNSKATEETTTSVPDDITNVVFLGIDKEENRSDVMMVLSINKTDNSLKIISILRDSKVMIEGCRYGTKLGFAYKWGGSAFAVKTINQNFNTEFNQFVTMNFENVEDVIDYIGGVEIELTAEEAAILNSSAANMGYYGYDACEGTNTLNGIQAVAFSRIRNTDGGEYVRASRQQVVLKAMFKGFKSVPKSHYPELIRLVLNCVETTLDYSDMWGFATSMDINTLAVSNYTIPSEDYEKNLVGDWEEVEGWDADIDYMIDQTQWVWIYDLDEASERLKDIINGD